jgi:multiple sugar transport system permease protein
LTLANYVRLFETAGFWQAVQVSVTYVVLSITFALLIGFATALLLNARFRGRTLARMLAVMPWAIPPVVAVNIWWWILDPSFGMLNWVLLLAGAVNWITPPNHPARSAWSRSGRAIRSLWSCCSPAYERSAGSL